MSLHLKEITANLFPPGTYGLKVDKDGVDLGFVVIVGEPSEHLLDIQCPPELQRLLRSELPERERDILKTISDFHQRHDRDVGAALLAQMLFTEIRKEHPDWEAQPCLLLAIRRAVESQEDGKRNSERETEVFGALVKILGGLPALMKMMAEPVA